MSGILHSMLYSGTGGGAAFTIDVNRANFNLYDELILLGDWNGISKIFTSIEISSGVFLYASSTGNFALELDSRLPPGSNINIINNGFILGKGGNGGNGRKLVQSSPPGTPGTPGGTAIKIAFSGIINITNNNVIGGGGGGGGGSGDLVGGGSRTGGGGGGCPIGQGGILAGGSASFINPGAGASIFGTAPGGNGGFYGAVGATGGIGGGSGDEPGAGGAAGNAVIGNSAVVWKSVGSIFGALIP